MCAFGISSSPRHQLLPCKNYEHLTTTATVDVLSGVVPHNWDPQNGQPARCSDSSAPTRDTYQRKHAQFSSCNVPCSQSSGNGGHVLLQDVLIVQRSTIANREPRHDRRALAAWNRTVTLTTTCCAAVALATNCVYG